MAFPMCNTGFFRRSGQSFFFDNFPVSPIAVFSARKLTSLSGDIAFSLRNSGNTETANIEFNADGSLTSSSFSSNVTFPTLGDCITNGIELITTWPDQISGGSITGSPISGVLMNVGLDINGNAYVYGPNITGNSIYTFTPPSTYIQPITIVITFQASASSTAFKTVWALRNAANSANVGQHQSHFTTTFGTVSFGTIRTITENVRDAISVIQYTGNGASGNVWVDNLPESPASMGTNGVEGTIRFGCNSELYSDFILFDNSLTTGERTDLYNELNGYYVL